ncbi:MAG: hypothetical protein K2X32_06300 [Phycisphaerales bacterium]|nr:hypothetical protein [Phycisphaerales bacterium]
MLTRIRPPALAALFALACSAAVALAQPCTIAWSIPADRPTGTINDLLIHENTLIARGGGIAINGVPVRGLAQWNGTTWTDLNAGLTTPFVAGQIASFGGRIYASGASSTPFTNNGRIWTGSTWIDWPGTPSPNGLQFPGALYSLPNGKLLVGGNLRFPDTPTGDIVDRRIAYWNGSSYEMLSSTVYGPTTPINGPSGNIVFHAVIFQGKLLLFGPGRIARGPRFNSDVIICPTGIVSFDGSTFECFTAPPLNGGIQAVAVFNGELYVSGTFTATADGTVQLNQIARYSGGQWQKVGNGITRPAEFMRVLNDGSGDKLHIFVTGFGTTVAYNNPNSTTLDTITFAGVIRFDGDRYTSYGATAASGFFGGSVYDAVNFDPGTGNAIFVGGGNTSFSPGGLPNTTFARRGPTPSPDTDGDGLLDIWEQNGLDINCDGVIDLNLPALGANWQRKDLFVEVDSMVGRTPSQATLNRVVAAFGNAPNALINNPSGIDGIRLNLIVDPADQSIPLQNFPNDFVEFHALKATRFGNAADRASPNAANILEAKRQVFRYCIFANTYGTTTSSGLAELPGNDFMVTLGGWRTPGGTPDQQASTFMHELGHTLGLFHGGHQGDEDKHNFKPNYRSIMNYSWQTASDRPGWTLDYSRQALPNLNENALDELNGIGGSLSVITVAGPLPPVEVLESGPIDWDRDGDFEPLTLVTADINRVDPEYPATKDILEGSEDWSRLVYDFRDSPNFAAGVSPVTTINVERLTQELADRINAIGAAAITRVCAADIAYDTGDPLPPFGPTGPAYVNNGVTEADYNLFFANIFDASPICDIADDTGQALPPFGNGGNPPFVNNGTTEGDYNLFFAIYLNGCAL